MLIPRREQSLVDLYEVDIDAFETFPQCVLLGTLNTFSSLECGVLVYYLSYTWYTHAEAAGQQISFVAFHVYPQDLGTAELGVVANVCGFVFCDTLKDISDACGVQVSGWFLPKRDQYNTTRFQDLNTHFRPSSRTRR
jgi:hypothetical protein